MVKVMVLIESEQAQASDEPVLEDPRRNGGCNRFTRPRAKGGLPPAVRDALRRSRSVTGEGIRAPKGARPAARRDQHAQHRQPPQQPPGGYPQRRWTPARPRSPLPRRRLGCRSVWRDPASRCLVARPPAASGGCRAGHSSVRRSRLRATSLETESSVASIFAKYPRYLGVLTPITMGYPGISSVSIEPKW